MSLPDVASLGITCQGSGESQNWGSKCKICLFEGIANSDIFGVLG